MNREVLNELTPSYVFGMRHRTRTGLKGVIDDTALFFALAVFLTHIQRALGIGANEDPH
jgi:hypothetical protein